MDQQGKYHMIPPKVTFSFLNKTTTDLYCTINKHIVGEPSINLADIMEKVNNITKMSKITC